MDKFDVTPAPGLLKRLGDIDYAVWQCIAELVDNSVDAFASAVERGVGSMFPEVRVTLPTRDALAKDPEACVEVRDNGVGMQADTLERAVKAGYSGNDPIGKLGLFGMGFNVATARLGGCTEVWTCQRDDATWTGLQIDYEEIGRSNSFKVPRLARPRRASDPSSGTIVRISKLKKELLDRALSPRGISSLKSKLGTTYGHIILKLGLKLYINDSLIEAYRFCTWSHTRSVTHQAIGEVPAILDISKDFGSLPYCAACWAWLVEGASVCSKCNSDKSIRMRTRRLTGWIGVQRYFHKDDFGFDLIRNGRVIEPRNKAFFSWVNPVDGDVLPEYPIDGVVGGRFVGELEMDFVPVGYRKDAFERASPEWRLVYEFLHGAGPILPEVAARLNFDAPSSPLYRLHAAYRRVNPGLRYLVPGGVDGGVDNISAQQWAEFFHEGKAEYQSDEKWYEAAKAAEEFKKQGNPTTPAPGTGTGLGGLPLPGGTTTGVDPVPGASPVSPPTQTEQRDEKLSRKYELKLGEQRVEVSVRATKASSPLPNNIRSRALPKNKVLEFTYDAAHLDYHSGTASPNEDLVVEVGYQLKQRAGDAESGVALAVIVDRLREQYFAESTYTLAALKERARRFLERTKAKLVEWLAANGAHASPPTASELELIAKRVLQVEQAGQSRVQEVIKAGLFPQYLPLTSLPEVVRRSPAAVMDGRLFRFPYDGISPDLREQVALDVYRALADAAWVLDADVSDSSAELAPRVNRAAASLELLEKWCVP